MRLSNIPLAVVLSAVLSYGSARADSPTVEDPLSGHSYVRFDTPLAWNDARTQCESLGGYLATLTSQSENDFVWTHVGSVGIGIWLGGTDEALEGTWQWVSGEAWAYTNWDAGQPDNGSEDQHCLSFSVSSEGLWDDDAGTTEYAFICEWESGPISESVPLPAGCLRMGDAFAEGLIDELPVHDVCVSAFEIDFHEVTNREYQACVLAGGCTPPSSSQSQTRTTYYGDPAFDDYPAIHINWADATDYCTWLGKRLPTEAEWEYAARGGLPERRYPGGDALTCNDANYGRSSPGDPCWNASGLENDTHRAASYPPNGYGIYDTAGNVMEWVNDWYDVSYYTFCQKEGIVNDPPGSTVDTHRVLRGGAWQLSSFSARVANRDRLAPDLENATVGFRCVRSGSCVDNDHDGYGNPANTDCIYPEPDCDDTDPALNPGITELCENGIDDDCDDLIDVDDPDCTCVDNDGDGYGDPPTPACAYSTFDCDDDPSDDPPSCATCTCGEAPCNACARCINPGVSEGPPEDPMCFDGVDNDCDKRLDADFDSGCQKKGWAVIDDADASNAGADTQTGSRCGNMLAALILPISAIILRKWVRRRSLL